MIKVGLVKEKENAAGRQKGLIRLLQGCLPETIIPLSNILPGQQQIEFWQVAQRPYGSNKEKSFLMAAAPLEMKVRRFARKIEKQRMAVCGGACWDYKTERLMQKYNAQTIFTGGFSLALFAVFDFLLKRADFWRKKDVVILDADNQLGRFAALCLGTEAKLLLLTGKDRQALELLSEEILAKTGLAARIVSEEKALHWAELAFFTGEKKQISSACVQWDLAAIAGLREYSPGAKMGSRFSYPAYGKGNYLSAGWLSAMLLAQYEKSGATAWQEKTPSEKICFWGENWQYFGISPIFFLQKENGKQFCRIFGRENLC